MVERYGIDVSRWQGVIDWDKLAENADLSFVILRAASGCAYDSKFKEYIKEIKRVKIPFGLYFASTALSVEDAEKEADFAIGVLREHGSDYPAFYDVELASQKALGTETVTAILKTWLDRVSAAGYNAGYYTNKAWLDTVIDEKQLEGYPLWYAAYPSVSEKTLTDAPKDNREKLSYPQAAIWQWSSNGRVDGINAKVDLNVCYETYPASPKKEYLTLADIKAMGYKGFIIE